MLSLCRFIVVVLVVLDRLLVWYSVLLFSVMGVLLMCIFGCVCSSLNRVW